MLLIPEKDCEQVNYKVLIKANRINPDFTFSNYRIETSVSVTSEDSQVVEKNLWIQTLLNQCYRIFQDNIEK